ncbi:hypothetical protein OnM2_010008 [Erysiphe neolycopersici]|uniref:Uncharacterized protein n=1 Tax=Erysiphe neolycopersici TaxID=212602 RepID=A0A420I6L2_9PEZI|nr:hypothetical protein OnM2_010008 [Erysiphe neolycopersici]
MRQRPQGAMQGDPAFKHEKDPVAKAHDFQGSNRPPRVPNKLRKEHRQTICSSSGRSRIACPKWASDSLRIRPSRITNETLNTSSLQEKISELSAESQRVSKAMLESRGSKAQNLPKSSETRSRTSKLQKKDGNDLAQKKPQKKKSENHSKKVRVKEMATTYDSTQYTVAITAEIQSARLKKRKRKSTRSGEKYTYGNSSLTSLDIKLSPRCSLSDPSDRAAAYMLSALDALSARPTIKYATKPRYVPQSSHIIGGLENEGRRLRRTTISEADLMASKRVDRLADRLSTHELRELMERDQKRKEKKRMVELAHMEKRLNQWAEMQTTTRVDESHESPTEDEPSILTQRPQLAQKMSEPIFGQKEKNLAYSKEHKQKQTFSSFQAETSANGFPDLIIQSPIIDDSDPNKIIPTSTPQPVDIADEVSPTKKANRTRLSQYLALRLSTHSAASPLPVEKASKSQSKPPQSWSIFNLSNKNKRKSVPPSFSTTSRDSLPSGNLSHFCHTPMMSASSIPKRTVSRFREDLPELPISSQSSRALSFVTQELQEKTSKSRIIDSSIEVNKTHKDTFTNDQNYLDYKNPTDDISSSGHMVRMDTSSCSNTKSQSLRSIDLEASLISNGKRLLQKSSRKVKKQLKSKSSLKSEKNKRHSVPATEQQVSMIDKEDYFGRWSTDNSDIYAQSSRNCDEEASSENKKWGAVARQPQVVHSSSAAHRSRHGILNEIDNEAEVNSYSVSSETSTIGSKEDASN